MFPIPRSKRVQSPQETARKKRLVDCAHNLIKLGESQLNEKVQFSETRKCVLFNNGSKWITCPGLVDMLQTTFYPQYDYYKALNIARKVAKKTVAPVTQASSLDSVVLQQTSSVSALLRKEKKNFGTNGRDFGSMVDNEFSLLAEREIATGARKKLIETKIESGSTLLYSRLLLNYIARCGWNTYKTQFVIHDPSSGIATRIDAIYSDNDNHLIVAEHKTGFDGYLDYANSYMMEPLRDVPNSPRNQHVLQCGWAYLVLEKVWNVKVHQSVVIYITETECKTEPLPQWFYDKKEEIWARFQDVASARIV